MVTDSDRHVRRSQAPAIEVRDGEAVGALDVRDADCVDRHDHGALMERVAVLDVRPQCEGGRVVVRAEEHGDAGHARERRIDRRQRVEELAQRALLRAAVAT